MLHINGLLCFYDWRAGVSQPRRFLYASLTHVGSMQLPGQQQKQEMCLFICRRCIAQARRDRETGHLLFSGLQCLVP